MQEIPAPGEKKKKGGEGNKKKSIVEHVDLRKPKAKKRKGKDGKDHKANSGLSAYTHRYEYIHASLSEGGMSVLTLTHMPIHPYP